MEIENISYKNYLSNISISFKSSCVYGIVGSSKTTMLNILSGDILPTKGSIKNQKSVKYLKQNPIDMFFCKTVLKQLEFCLENHTFKDIEKRINDSLIMVGLNKSYLKKDPYKLSSVEKRKLGLACTLITNPKILLLDEPVIDFNYKEKLEIIKLIKKLKNRYNKTIIISTNDTDFLHKIVDYVYVLNKGKILLEGNKYDVFTKDLTQFGILPPKEIEFSNKVLNKKNIKIGYRDDINDLIKDIYRFVK